MRWTDLVNISLSHFFISCRFSLKVGQTQTEANCCRSQCKQRSLLISCLSYCQNWKPMIGQTNSSKRLWGKERKIYKKERSFWQGISVKTTALWYRSAYIYIHIHIHIIHTYIYTYTYIHNLFAKVSVFTLLLRTRLKAITGVKLKQPFTHGVLTTRRGKSSSAFQQLVSAIALSTTQRPSLHSSRRSYNTWRTVESQYAISATSQTAHLLNIRQIFYNFIISTPGILY